MVIHVASLNWYTTDVHMLEWQAMNFWHGSIVRWAVPIFTMISGVLFLSRDIPLRKIYDKYIFRIFTAFVFWSFVYACAYYSVKGDALKAVGHFLGGHFHMWFLFMIVGLYAVTPFVRKIAESEMLTKYFLVMAFVFAFLLPETVNVISVFSEKYGEFAGGIVSKFNLQFVSGFTGYFLLGYYLNNARISPKAERLIYAAGILGCLSCIIMSSLVSISQNAPNGTFYSNLTVNTLCEAAAVFVFFRKRLNIPARFIRSLSDYSFGAYLVHAGVITTLSKLGLHSLTFSPAISIPVISVIVFVLSFVISAILNHIPILKKYIV